MFYEDMGRYKTMIERRLLAALECIHAEKTLSDAMEYALSGGKRLRGAIVLSICEALGGPIDVALDFAAAVEMVHAYSLIHDDLPCMDNDDYRRGKPSCHKAFGYATALLAGDALLTEAFSVAASSSSLARQRVLGIRVLATAAGASGMVSGQVMDLAMEGRSLGMEKVREMYAKKTGAMFEVSARLGAILSDAQEDVEAAVARWGALFGHAFQVLDDIDDLSQSPKEQRKDVLAKETSLESALLEARKSLEAGLVALKTAGCEGSLAFDLTHVYLEKTK